MEEVYNSSRWFIELQIQWHVYRGIEKQDDYRSEGAQTKQKCAFVLNSGISYDKKSQGKQMHVTQPNEAFHTLRGN